MRRGWVFDGFLVNVPPPPRPQRPTRSSITGVWLFGDKMGMSPCLTLKEDGTFEFHAIENSTWYSGTWTFDFRTSNVIMKVIRDKDSNKKEQVTGADETIYLEISSLKDGRVPLSRSGDDMPCTFLIGQWNVSNQTEWHNIKVFKQ